MSKQIKEKSNKSLIRRPNTYYKMISPFFSRGQQRCQFCLFSPCTSELYLLFVFTAFLQFNIYSQAVFYLGFMSPISV